MREGRGEEVSEEEARREGGGAMVATLRSEGLGADVGDAGAERGPEAVPPDAEGGALPVAVALAVSWGDGVKEPQGEGVSVPFAPEGEGETAPELEGSCVAVCGDEGEDTGFRLGEAAAVPEAEVRLLALTPLAVEEKLGRSKSVLRGEAVPAGLWLAVCDCWEEAAEEAPLVADAVPHRVIEAGGEALLVKVARDCVGACRAVYEAVPEGSGVRRGLLEELPAPDGVQVALPVADVPVLAPAVRVTTEAVGEGESVGVTEGLEEAERESELQELAVELPQRDGAAEWLDRALPLLAESAALEVSVGQPCALEEGVGAEEAQEETSGDRVAELTGEAVALAMRVVEGLAE